MRRSGPHIVTFGLTGIVLHGLYDTIMSQEDLPNVIEISIQFGYLLSWVWLVKHVLGRSEHFKHHMLANFHVVRNVLIVCFGSIFLYDYLLSAYMIGGRNLAISPWSTVLLLILASTLLSSAIPEASQNLPLKTEIDEKID